MNIRIRAFRSFWNRLQAPMFYMQINFATELAFEPLVTTIIWPTHRPMHTNVSTIIHTCRPRRRKAGSKSNLFRENERELTATLSWWSCGTRPLDLNPKMLNIENYSGRFLSEEPKHRETPKKEKTTDDCGKSGKSGKSVILLTNCLSWLSFPSFLWHICVWCSR